MKAWFVFGDPSYEWGDWVHGETATKAKSMFWDFWSGVYDDSEGWTFLRPRRCPRLDDIPINRENISKGLTEQEIKDWEINRRDLICKCNICSGDNIVQTF